MKKALSIALISILILSCFSFVTFAEESYDSTWSITTDKESYNAGDYLVLTITNSDDFLADAITNGFIHFTFDENILEYTVWPDDRAGLISAGFRPTALPSEFITLEGGADIEADGEYSAGLASSGVWPYAGDNICRIYFKVKSDISGVQELNFRWIKNASDNPSYVGYVKDGSVQKYYFDIKFVDKTVKIVGSELASEPMSLPAAYAYASENDLNTTDINGKEVEVTTDYAVAFGKVAVRKAEATRVKAGFLLSKTNENMTIDNSNIKDFEAINVSSENIFGGLFYGTGLEAGETYYVMPYVTYSDGVTLYASEAASFTMPE